MTDQVTRAKEHQKYSDIYARMPEYRMGGVRKQDAKEDLETLATGSLLDVGCGRGEVLDLADEIGLHPVCGIEVVEHLCDGKRVIHGMLPNLPIKDAAFDHVTCFDVLEHLPPGDETPALYELKRVARRTVIVTANNRQSRDPQTGANLHINIREYSEWEKILNEVFGAEIVQRIPKRYVSATWWIYLDGKPG